MNCKTIHKKIIFWIDGELPAEEMNQINLHLAVCKECTAFATDMQKTLGILTSEKNQEANPFFYTRVKARLENAEPNEFSRETHSLWNRVLQPAFFSVLLIVGIYIGFKIGRTSSYRHSHEISKMETIPYLNEMSAETIENFLMQ